jgi:6-phospho-3-hexuloisomerase
MSDQITDLARQICDEIATAVGSVPDTDRRRAIELVTAARRIFVFGEGRSGLVLRMAAMRLVHLGLTAHVVGDATTPAIGAGDLLIAASGSGETAVTLLIADQAHRAGATLLAVTANVAGSLAASANATLLLRTPAKGDRGTGQSIQPGGSLFEQSMLVLFDTLFLMIAGDTAAQQIEERHANLE